MIVDLHCHLLPGVDDGPKTMAEALQMAQAAVTEGIQYSLVTPHHLNGVYCNHPKDILDRTRQFQSALKAAHIPLTLYASQEVHLTGKLLEALAQKDILFVDPHERYLLLELPRDGVPAYTWDMLDELHARQIQVIIVHPERNQGIQAEPDLLYRLVAAGCLSQLTAGSYVGRFGKKTQRLTEQFIAAGLGHIFASDAHNLQGRRFYLAAAFQKLKAKKAEIATDYQRNAIALINGEAMTPRNFHKITKYKRFWLF